MELQLTVKRADQQLSNLAKPSASLQTSARSAKDVSIKLVY
jgi:hypothetical protein